MPQVEEVEEASSTFDVLKKKDKVVVCRICKGDHWTLKCPYKDTLGAITDINMTDEPGAGGKDDSAGGPSAAPSASGKYVPPSMRAGAGGDASKRRGETMGRPGRGDDDATLRVTNVSEDTQEHDLQELFRPFGHVMRTYIGRDKITGAPKGMPPTSAHISASTPRALTTASVRWCRRKGGRGTPNRLCVRELHVPRRGRARNEGHRRLRLRQPDLARRMGQAVRPGRTRIMRCV